MSDHAHLPDEHGPGSRYDHKGDPAPTGFWRSRTGLVTIGLLAVGAFFLVTEHQAHLVPYLGYLLPLVLILACLPLHFRHGGHGGQGGHGGHGGHGGQGREEKSDDDPSDSQQNTPTHHH